MADRQELVERLRNEGAGWKDDFRTQSLYGLLTEAADLLEHDAAVLERLRKAFDRISGLPDPGEHIEDFAERVECGDAVRIAYTVGDLLQRSQQADSGEGK